MRQFYKTKRGKATHKPVIISPFRRIIISQRTGVTKEKFCDIIKAKGKKAAEPPSINEKPKATRQ